MTCDEADDKSERDRRDSGQQSPDIRAYFFVDEAGNFDFSKQIGASRYFILTSVTMTDCHQAEALLELRRQLVWEGHPLTDAFHATEDKQAVRNRVFELVAGMKIRVDATICGKSRANNEQQGMLAFYRSVWLAHAARVIPQACPPTSDLLVVAASIGTRNEQKAIGLAISEVVQQSGRSVEDTRVAYWPGWSDPCLQVADYCCWAIQRKWERNDDRSFMLIEHLVNSEVLATLP